VLYYVVVNLRYGQRDGHGPLEVYKLVNGAYELQAGEPVWMPEIGLGIGRCVVASDPMQRSVLGWFDQRGDRYLTAEEQVERERQVKEQERQVRRRLENYLRSQGIDPDQIPDE
jgi:hypothetical protein